MRSLYNKFPVLHAVFGDLILIERMVFPSPVRADFALHNLHNPPLFVFKLLCVNHDWKRFRDQIQNNFIVHIRVLSLAKRNHSAPCGFAGIRVNCGYNRVTGSRGFLSRISLTASHFSDHNIVRVKTERHIQQIVLRDGFALVLGFAGDGVDNLV